MSERSPTGLERARSAVSRNRVRILFAALIVLSVAVLVSGATAGGLSTATEEDVPTAPESNGHTVITESGRAGTITAYEPDGSILYYENERTKYFDVDPVEGEPLTVEYAATDTIHSEGPTCGSPPCSKNVIERTDLETGETEVLVERYEPQEIAAEWHDVDRLDENRFIVADIHADEVFILNTETGMKEWTWDAQADYPVEGGGPYPGDWTHINDVEYIESEGDPMDGNIMVSMRNQNQVVFIDPDEGLQEEWTLGTQDDTDPLYQQHNPDYIPTDQGGPAIVVADSENGNVEEFQRENGEWTQTWTWSDEQIQWPRDADRLPNGNTLITDSHGNRVIEVNPDGEIVWEVGSTMPYEAERLESGDESEGGESAQQLGLNSRTPDEDTESGSAGSESGFDPLGVIVGLFDEIGTFVESLLPHRIHNAILFISPVWMGTAHFAAIGVGILTALAWVGTEVAWQLRDAGVRARLPVYRER
ncbi:arylsulfotransferase (ASST) [Halalkalicoccus paucihalophilus]|uniref:Arylsulfotransferase (ASST) n=1 Tax=Halalkalicoccus paucihalophilus TaxID=1008153 RepID=A0A151AFJ8_9EURY|nr:aryl-sulfate sulfotransferase [Halalkalicoccus paucihalophilus]KYH26354.1 arylsulfotransferase (ASST) [Halalkalicoccus paucihalophilus]